MHIQCNTDDNLAGSQALERAVEETVESTLGRFRDRITRVEVHLADVNAERNGPRDLRCLMEARPRARDPVAVTHRATTLEEAYGGAARKLVRLLETTFGRAEQAKGAPSIRDNDLR